MTVQASLDVTLKNEIARLSKAHGIDSCILEDFAHFVLVNCNKKAGSQGKKISKAKALTMSKLKEAVYGYFGVKSTDELKKTGAFRMAIDGMDELNLSRKEAWEVLYRKFIGVLPNEESETGYGCINGIDIFKYFKPWQVFGLDAESATIEDIKAAYRNLSKTYHPDVPNTGDSKIFERINTMYQSISVGA